MRRVICVVALFVLLVGSTAGAATRYVIKDLGFLPGHDNSAAGSINNKGQILGTSYSSSDGQDGSIDICHPFLWQDGKMTEVKAPLGKHGVVFTGINDAGQILLSIGLDSFIVQNGAAKKIEPLPGCVQVMAQAMNNRGDVVGLCASKERKVQRFLLHDGAMQALTTPVRANMTFAMPINDKGQIAWNNSKTNGQVDLVLWENGKALVLKDMPDLYAVADIANDGTIVGYYIEDGKESAFVRRNGTIKYLKAPTGLSGGSADALNGNGMVVGSCDTKDGDSRAVAWDKNGVPTALPGLGGAESEAYDINDAGVIVGWATDKEDNGHAVMWTPVK